MPTPKTHLVTLGLGHTRYGGRPVAQALADRLAHTLCLGQTGTGKSTWLQSLALQDAKAGVGFCLIDPHGDLAEALRDRLSHRALYWDLADPNCNLGFNPLGNIASAWRPLVASALIETLKKQWSEAWGARMEHLLRYALLALLDFEDADMRDIMRLFLEKEFRQVVLRTVRDPQVRYFWETEFTALRYTQSFDGVSPIANKVGSLLAHPLVRRALCDPTNEIRFRSLMDDGRVLIINLAKGRLGSDTANVMGGLILGALMHAGFTRHGTGYRSPFLVYADEFQNFATATTANMLAETRKYGLGLTLAAQHLGQIDTGTQAALFGNVGSLLSFRVGVTDAPTLARHLTEFENRDLIALPNHHAAVRLLNAGQKTKGFSLTTLPV